MRAVSERFAALIPHVNRWTTEVEWSNDGFATFDTAGLPAGFHFHDLRHTGNNLAAASGASTRELMHRMGHGSMRAALIYQHATSERDREIAAALDLRIGREAGEKWPVSGPTAGKGNSLEVDSKDERPVD